MRGAATQAMPVCIVEERQQSRCPPAAAPLRAAARRPAAKCTLYFLTGPKLYSETQICRWDRAGGLRLSSDEDNSVALRTERVFLLATRPESSSSYSDTTLSHE